jgi:hypothetical protein
MRVSRCCGSPDEAVVPGPCLEAGRDRRDNGLGKQEKLLGR